MKKIGIAIMALCISTLSFAENNLHYNMLEFQESVSINVPNDTMHITLNMEMQHKNRQTASQITTQKLNQVYEKLKKNKKLTVELGNRSVYPQYDDKQKNIISWRDSVSLHVNSKEFEDLSNLISDVSAQATLERVWFSLSTDKRNQAVDKASEQVLDTLRQRADFLSRKLGFSSYQLVKVNMNSHFSGGNMYANDVAEMYAVRQSAPVAAAAPRMKVSSDMSGEQSISQTANVIVQMK